MQSGFLEELWYAYAVPRQVGIIGQQTLFELHIKAQWVQYVIGGGGFLPSRLPVLTSTSQYQLNGCKTNVEMIVEGFLEIR